MHDEDPGTIGSATIQKQANVYYDGKVTSRSVTTADGTRQTLGIMRPGVYTFETDDREDIEVMKGELKVEFDGQQARYTAGESFSIPPDTEFEVEVVSLVDYCCTYS